MPLTGTLKEARDLLDDIAQYEKLRKDLQAFSPGFVSTGIRKKESEARKKLEALKGKV